MKEESRGPWYLLTGLIIGLAFGLVYSWVISPIKYVDTSPESLRADFKDQYRALIAVSYLASGNLERARVRLGYLDQTDTNMNLLSQVEDAIVEGLPESEIKALELLAEALSGQAIPGDPLVQPSPTITQLPSETLVPSPVIHETATPEGVVEPTEESSDESTPRPPRTPTRTSTVLATRTPTLTPGPAFVLDSQEVVCDLTQGEAQIQVEVFNAALQPVPGIEIQVSWDGGEDYFYTGLKPEVSLGYADFDMTPGVTYQLQLSSGGNPVADLAVVECEGETGRFWGNLRLIFIQP